MSMSFGINLLGHMFMGISRSHVRHLGGGRSVGLRTLTTEKFALSFVICPLCTYQARLGSSHRRKLYEL